jgi:hypothetical protein
LLSAVVVLIRRCAWHPRYQGYPLVLGVAGWRGRHVFFSDGVCSRCADRIKDDLRLVSHGRRRAPAGPALSPAVAGLTAVVVGLAVARLVDHAAPVAAAMVPRLWWHRRAG